MGARRQQFIDPLWVGLDEGYRFSPTSHTGEVACFVWGVTPQSFGALPLRLGATKRPTASGRLLSVKTPETGSLVS